MCVKLGKLGKRLQAEDVHIFGFVCEFECSRRQKESENRLSFVTQAYAKPHKQTDGSLQT